MSKLLEILMTFANSILLVVWILKLSGIGSVLKSVAKKIVSIL